MLPSGPGEIIQAWRNQRLNSNGRYQNVTNGEMCEIAYAFEAKELLNPSVQTRRVGIVRLEVHPCFNFTLRLFRSAKLKKGENQSPHRARLVCGIQ